MRLYIIGDNHDDKGTQLEELTATLLKECGYDYVNRNPIDAGGSEIDVEAKRVYELAGIQKEIPVICECKAKSEPIILNDWLKFVGKVSIARMSNAQTEGVMIALSGANGNVIGNYNALPDKSYLHLITNDGLIKLVCRHYHLKDPEEIRNYFTHKTVRPIDKVELVYYEKQVWWIVSFVHDEFAVVTDGMTTVEDRYLNDFLGRLARYTTFKESGYVDVQKEEAAKLMAKLICKSMVYLLMGNEVMALSDLFKELQKFDYLKKIGQYEIEEQLGKCQYIKRDGDKIYLKDSGEIDIVDFYKWYDSAPMIIDGICTHYYITNIDEKLLERIMEIQENMEIPMDKRDDCMYILTLSPSALMYALQPDSVIVNSRKMGSGVIPQVNEFQKNYFMNKLADCLSKDLQDHEMSKFYCRKFGLDTYSVETEMTLRFAQKEFNKTIRFDSNVRFLNANGQIVPCLLFDKPKE